jgi:hypothetical protein
MLMEDMVRNKFLQVHISHVLYPFVTCSLSPLYVDPCSPQHCVFSSYGWWIQSTHIWSATAGVLNNHCKEHSARINNGWRGGQIRSLIYFEVKLNLERKSDEIVRRIRNSYEFYQIYKRNFMGQRDNKTTVYKIYFKSVLTYCDMRVHSQNSKIKRDAHC